MARLSFIAAMLRVSPPWLRRTFGSRIMESLGDPIETHVDRAKDGIKKKFPSALDEEALAMIGRERRIRRGPKETAATYATRIQYWLDDHKNRGGPYALLRQLYLFWKAALNVQIECVYHSGTRRTVNTSGVITRDSITWGADGTNQWAQFWLFFPGFPGSFLEDDNNNLFVTDEGDFIVTDAVDLDDAEMFRAVPREWNAAHILRITIVLLSGTARLWNYPQPVPTWTAWGASGATWMGGDQPVRIYVES